MNYEHIYYEHSIRVLPTKTANLRPILKTYLADEENQLPQVVL